MGYKKAAHILPQDLLLQIQQYIDGELIYIPRAPERRKNWGEGTATRRELRDRNEQIYQDHRAGTDTGALAEKYFLSEKSIQRIIWQLKKEYGN